MGVRWMRVVLGALLLEIVLVVTLVPLSFVNLTLFLIAVPIGAFAFGHLVTWWVLRKHPSNALLHGTLIGLVATAIYFGLVLAQPDGLASAVATYGVPLFWFSQLTRIAGCMTGGMHVQRRASTPRSAAGAI